MSGVIARWSCQAIQMRIDAKAGDGGGFPDIGDELPYTIACVLRANSRRDTIMCLGRFDSAAFCFMSPVLSALLAINKHSAYMRAPTGL